jgi:hypothetical protein
MLTRDYVNLINKFKITSWALALTITLIFVYLGVNTFYNLRTQKLSEFLHFVDNVSLEYQANIDTKVVKKLKSFNEYSVLKLLLAGDIGSQHYIAEVADKLTTLIEKEHSPFIEIALFDRYGSEIVNANSQNRAGYNNKYLPQMLQLIKLVDYIAFFVDKDRQSINYIIALHENSTEAGIYGYMLFKMDLKFFSAMLDISKYKYIDVLSLYTSDFYRLSQSGDSVLIDKTDKVLLANTIGYTLTDKNLLVVKKQHNTPILLVANIDKTQLYHSQHLVWLCACAALLIIAINVLVNKWLVSNIKSLTTYYADNLEQSIARKHEEIIFENKVIKKDLSEIIDLHATKNQWITYVFSTMRKPLIAIAAIAENMSKSADVNCFDGKVDAVLTNAIFLKELFDISLECSNIANNKLVFNEDDL